MTSPELISQQLLFPETVELNPSDYVTFISILEEFNSLGFDIRDLGNNCIIINGIPETVKNSGLKEIIESMLEAFKTTENSPDAELKDNIAIAFARATSIPYGKVLEQEEMRNLVDHLFACSSPNYSPSGKKIMNIISGEEIEKLLK
jgi:DNA mismatch repair protein MutL